MERIENFDDEIDLFELAKRLYAERKIIIFTTLIFLIIGIVSCFMPKVYKAEVIVETTTIAKIITPGELKTISEEYAKKNKTKIDVMEIKGADSLKISAIGNTSENAKRNLQDFINLVSNSSFKLKVDYMKYILEKRLKSIDETLNMIENNKSNIIEPGNISSLLYEKKLITEWIKNPRLLVLKSEIVSYDNPIKPKPLLYIAVSLISGIFIGIFVALLKSFFKSKKVEENRV
jgi:LPS O-antigen subunit length determinant protein (WzzB/FepE family)